MGPDIGTPNNAAPLVEEYLGLLPNQLLVDDTNALLASLLMELQAQRYAGNGPEDVSVYLQQRRRELESSSNDDEGVYHTETVEFGESDWTEVELEFTSSEIDLRRITGGVDVAYADPEHADAIPYNATDDPAVGVQVQTSKVWIKSQNGEGSQSVQLEAWS